MKTDELAPAPRVGMHISGDPRPFRRGAAKYNAPTQSVGASCRSNIASAILLTVLTLLLLLAGCRKDDEAVNPPGTPPAHPYGTGTMSFDASVNWSGHFSASGAYRRSQDFAPDTSSQGAGGFAADTTFNGKRVKAVFLAYTHTLSNGILNERIMIFSLRTDSAHPGAGNYPLSRLNATAASGDIAYAYFFPSESTNVHNEVYYPKSGTLSLTSFNPSTGHAAGSFSGTLYGPSPSGFHPDTSKVVEIASGAFDITASGKFFVYRNSPQRVPSPTSYR